MGLVMLGTASEKALDEMLQYAHETQHEKIIRGLAIGIAFLMFGKEDEADVLIERLLSDAVSLSFLDFVRLDQESEILFNLRMRSFDMVESTQSRWLTLELGATKRSSNSFTSLCRM